MQKLISKETESDLTKLGLYQIIGGAIGILIIFWSIYKSLPLEGLIILIYFFFLLFFSYSVFCGILCLKAKKNALVHSLLNQIFQLFGFAIMGFAFKYVAGFYFTIGLDLTNSIHFDFGIGISKIEFNFNNEKDRLEIDFNLVAIWLIYWIDKLMKKVKEEAAIRQANSIGEA
jgi:hypothetical protein